MLILNIYLYCVLGSCLYVGLIIWIGGPIAKNDEIFHGTYIEWKTAPFHYKLGVIFIPVINLWFTILALLLIIGFIRYQWWCIGLWLVKRMTRTTGRFRIKELMIRIFFRSHIDYFYKRYSSLFQNEMFEIVKTIKKYNDAKAKQQSEQGAKPEPDSKDQETPAER
jgi:hypothetical protein